MSSFEQYQHFLRSLCRVPSLGLSLDISRMGAGDDLSAAWNVRFLRSMDEMAALERGSIANPDENRMVGHYWLRAPRLAPTDPIRRDIEQAVARVKVFARDVHSGRTQAPSGGRFTQALCIGIGGSSLGPMFVYDALGDETRDPLRLRFLDNTDPEGITRTLRALTGLRQHPEDAQVSSPGHRASNAATSTHGSPGELDRTLVIVASKSGSTPETRNGMLIARAFFKEHGLDFSRHAVAITQEGSQLDKQAVAETWLARFPMWDWVGGRTSVLSAVGLLPGALQGVDVDELLAGAALCDEATRSRDLMRNPAALMAILWHHATGGAGRRDMVILPYCDRLGLLGRYLQQLIMESLGKRLDRQGRVVAQGLTVYGNKGSTDQHAYVQQLRDGLNNFFVTFVRVLDTGRTPATAPLPATAHSLANPGAPATDRASFASIEVEPGVTAADYLDGFLLGTREALSENGRPSMTLTLPRVDARSVGGLIALFERAVGLYASLINVNAYHQPGVEAGKKAAAAILVLRTALRAALTPEPRSAAELAAAIGKPEQAELTHLILEQLAAKGNARMLTTSNDPEPKFQLR